MSVRSSTKYKSLQKAREEDAKKGSRLVAIYLLDQGLDVSKIASATGLTLVEIERLKLNK